MKLKKAKWQSELELFSNLKSTIILDGNVYDKQLFLEEEDGEVYSSLLSLDEYLHEFLVKKGYAAITYFNHIDGFYNVFDPNEHKKFTKLVKQTDLDEQDQKLTNDGRSSKFGDATVHIRKAMRNEVEPVAIIMNLSSRYITSPTMINEQENYLYSELLLATLNKKENQSQLHGGEMLTNILIIVADKINDVPVWFYIDNPMIKGINVSLPNYDMRMEYINNTYRSFYGSKDIPEDKTESVKENFVDLTDGLTNIELNMIRELMTTEEITLEEIYQAVSLFKYGIKDNPWQSEHLIKRLDELEDKLKSRVKGQDECIAQVVDIVSRSIFGLSGLQHSKSSNKPRGIMFFSGPTGTGKTELAKALAEWLFGTEDACIRFDMSEYGQDHSDQKLLGAPPGYVGYESGGQLTNKVKENPFSILLFDEIDKAAGSIFDKFLQILEDGRITDGKGETVYFSDTIIIFTANKGMMRETFHGNEKLVEYGDSEKDYAKFKNTIMDGLKEFFVTKLGRPELANRIGDNFLIFKYINKETAEMILEMQLERIKKNLFDKNEITIHYNEQFVDDMRNVILPFLEDGGRGIGNAVEKHFINPLSRFIAMNKVLEPTTININGLITDSSISTLDAEIE